MIVVDSSVWIDYFRDARTPQVERLDALLDEPVLLLGDLVLCELLRGVRNEGEAVRVSERLGVLPRADMVGERVARLAAYNYRLLRGRGVTIRNTVDLLIGAYCIEHGHQLLHNDRDFRPMIEHLGLVEA